MITSVYGQLIYEITKVEKTYHMETAARVTHLPSGPVHGKTSEIEHSGTGIYEGLPSPVVGGRYHSLAVDEASLPAELEVTARAGDRIIMGIRHR